MSSILVKAEVRPRLAEAGATLRVLATLFKLRIVALLLLAATAGAFLGAGGWPGTLNLLLLLVTGGMAAAGASALNQYIEQESDARMGRTRRRPLVTGAIARPQWVAWVGGSLILLPSLAVLPFNAALSFFLVLGALIYVGIYTLWLKPRTLLNIVIGGAAGSAAVMSGGAAAGAWREPAVIVLALVLFLWTPSHFWSLAMLCRKDYRRAGTPMLPAQCTRRGASWWVLLHTVATAATVLLMGFVPSLGWLYFLPVLLASAYLLRRNVALVREPSAARARTMFLASNLYLMGVLLAILLATLVPPSP
jgi:protoheme IX farnesyltransferase